MTYVNTEKITINPVTAKAAKDWIVKNHYSHRAGPVKYPFGVFYTEDEEHEFFNEPKETMIGALTYGHPVGFRVIKSICDFLESDEVLELTRLHINDGYGRNVESYVIGQTFDWIKKNDPNIKVLISYADPEYGHAGKIYQATNWIYQGCGYSKLMPDYFIRIEGKDEWIHSRTAGERYGEKNIEKMAKKIGRPFYRKEQSSKHRYIYFLCSRSEKRKIIKNLKHPIVPYPKTEDGWVAPIEKIWIENNEVKRKVIN